MWRYKLLLFCYGLFFLCFPPLGTLAEAGVSTITPKTLNWWMEYGESFTLINVNSYLECMDARIPKSLCISCDEAEKVQNYLPSRRDAKIVFYDGTTDLKAKCPLLEEVLKQGYRQIYILQGGMQNWKLAGFETESIDRIPRVFVPAIKANDLETWLKTAKNPLILDIRPAHSFQKGHLEKALNLPLSQLHTHYQDVPLNRSLLVVDEDGAKSLLAASYLARKGFQDIRRLHGGMVAWERFKRVK